MRRINIISWMSILGLLGLLGLLFFTTGRAKFLTYFAFFGFFSCYWKGKLAREARDERFIQNRQRAYKIGLRLGFSIIFAGMIIVNNIWGRDDPTTAYALLLALISLSFALCVNLTSFLTYKFDREE